MASKRGIFSRGILSLLSFPEAAAPAGEGDALDSYGFIFGHLPALSTPRLILRPMAMRDAADIYLYSRDPQVAQHVLWEPHESIHQTRSYIRYVLRQYRNGEPSTFCIEETGSGRVIGTIGFMWLHPENRSCEVGYSLSRAYWNRGYMTEALSAVIDFGFQRLQLNRIEAQHETDNPASGRVMEKAGMRREGVLRSRLFNKTRFVDVALYAILRSDWDKAHTNP